MIRLNKLPDVPELSRKGSLREMEAGDVKQVAALYTRFMERYGMVPVMTEEDVKHQFLSGLGRGDRPPGVWKGRREGQVVWAYVVEVGYILF